MGWLGVFLMVYFCLIAPVTIRLDAAAAKGLTGAVVIRVWGVPLILSLIISRTPEGKLMLNLRREGSTKNHQEDPRSAADRVRLVLSSLKRANWTRWFLAKVVRWEFIALRLRVSTGRADQTALIWGGLQGIISVLQEALDRRAIPSQLVVQADFSFKGSAAEAGCILFVRLGNLLAAGLLILIAVRRSRRAMQAQQTGEGTTWSTQSGA